ncbi:RraA family protein [Tsuneonella sp. CC-YZS046]|uniref:RraA family protein n=1 Tax=Tsuneonella sp. CC-YZS046 TaxID=3042152 RepID=UPI002D7A0D86|nr:RraA family protein [Tsuneonella sp. CC-YZS046]WRO68237.1 RraA family protein [Tsuneonella sp. CC-YZS046]
MSQSNRLKSIERLRSYPVAPLSDALGKRGIGRGIKRVCGDAGFCGWAVTAIEDYGSSAAVRAAARLIEEGGVLLAATPGEGAALGENLAAEIARRGGAGVVIDGQVRDLSGMTKVGLPVYARSLTALGKRPLNAGAVDIPILIGGTVVFPGDYVVADDDGVVVIPQRELDETLAMADKIMNLESEIYRASLAGDEHPIHGMSDDEITAMFADAWRVHTKPPHSD